MKSSHAGSLSLTARRSASIAPITSSEDSRLFLKSPRRSSSGTDPFAKREDKRQLNASDKDSRSKINSVRILERILSREAKEVASSLNFDHIESLMVRIFRFQALKRFIHLRKTFCQLPLYPFPEPLSICWYPVKSRRIRSIPVGRNLLAWKSRSSFEILPTFASCRSNRSNPHTWKQLALRIH